MALDISLDLPQIMGRQRLGENVFRCDATFYYKEYVEFNADNEKEFISQIYKKQTISEGLIENYNNCDAAIRSSLGDKYRTSQKVDKFSKDYVAVIDDAIDGKQRVVFNQLAMFNEIRAWDIQKSQYMDGCQVMRSIEDSTKSITEDAEIKTFLMSFNGDFETRMKLYREFLQQHPDYKEMLERLPQIPLDIKVYYNRLGPHTLRSMSYKEADIKRVLGYESLQETIKDVVKSTFNRGRFYSLKQVKTILQNIYVGLGVAKKSRSTDLKTFVNCNEKQMTINGVRENGYLIQ
jgi:hypothetical protein